jgi:hypothetical protein
MNRNFFDQFTPEQMRAQYARCLPGLQHMLGKAERTKRKVNGYTAYKLRCHLADFERKGIKI